jgi:hypothetical protein
VITDAKNRRSGIGIERRVGRSHPPCGMAIGHAIHAYAANLSQARTKCSPVSTAVSGLIPIRPATALIAAYSDG